ncbi:flavodoxin [Limnoglobus roseus]|uniref:Flavodoxin n=1 Tax=Limnoglobus roseus TaxID=2598579 RepID=A0A5C1AEG0_9BACT|nr:flavodoxin family protein [Limnoglobus roseus]QEL15464.1 flavodoxin [Limnoglobus roseus]
MGKVLVLYHSASGNTATMARLVAEGAGLIPGTEVRLREVDVASPEDVHWCDGLAVGSPTNMGVLSWKMKRFWDEAMFDYWGKVACAFSSSGGWGGGSEIACQSLQMVLMNFGFLVFGVTDYAGKMTTCHYGAVAAREPRDGEVQGSVQAVGAAAGRVGGGRGRRPEGPAPARQAGIGDAAGVTTDYFFG